jgi:hypothetical protein
VSLAWLAGRSPYLTLADRCTGRTARLFMVPTAIGPGTGKANCIAMAVQPGCGQMGHKNDTNMANYTEMVGLL